MTLRTRLTVAFLAVVLGPILVGGIAVGAVATIDTRDREAQTLIDGREAVNRALITLCQQARAAAEALAATAVAQSDNPEAAVQTIFARKLSDALRLEGPDGDLRAGIGRSDALRPRTEWGDCLSGASGTSPVIAAGVELREVGGGTVGWARAAFEVDKQRIRDLADLSGVGVSVRLGNGQLLSAHQPQGQTRTITLAPGPGQPLHLVLSTHRANLTQLYAVMSVIAVVVAILAVVAARWLARTLTRPLAELAGAAEQVAGGDLATRVPVRGRDEIGRLAQTFNHMIRDLQAYVGALMASRNQLRGTLLRLGEALSSSHDATSIAEVTLETAMAATGAQSGIVLLIETDEYPPRLVGRAVGGTLSGVKPSDIALTLGEGIVGKVAERGVPSKGRLADGRGELAPNEPRYSTHIAVPFIRSGAGQRVFGVLALYDRLSAGEQADEFDDTDVRTLLSFASQATVALERLRNMDKAMRSSENPRGTP